MRVALRGLVLFLVAVARDAPGEEFRPAIVVRPVRPEIQGQRFLALFDGSRARSPAAALAAWKHATQGRETLGKTWEAAIAALNPGMVRELRLLDGAELALTLGDRATWYAAVPGDDGTLAALATALVLTDGAAEPPVGDVPVDRLGPAGAPLLARPPRGVALAGRRAELGRALRRLSEKPQQPAGPTSGWFFDIDPDALALGAPANRARLTEVLRGHGCRALEGVVRLDGEILSTVVRGQTAAVTLSPARISAQWFDWIPAMGTAVAAAWALDSRPEAWDALFAFADRLEKADPAHVRTAPLRTRLNLLALGARVRPDIDLWPRLRGVSACLTTSARGDLEGVLIALHTVDPAAADELARRVLPRLSARFTSSGPGPTAAADGILGSGQVSGRPIRWVRRDATVLIGWGPNVIEASLEAQRHADRSAGPAIRASWTHEPPQRAGAFWPGRMTSVVPEGSALALALAASPPVTWRGTNRGATTRDEIQWAGIRDLIRRFLDNVPLEAPMAR